MDKNNEVALPEPALIRKDVKATGLHGIKQRKIFLPRLSISGAIALATLVIGGFAAMFISILINGLLPVETKFNMAIELIPATLAGLTVIGASIAWLVTVNEKHIALIRSHAPMQISTNYKNFVISLQLNPGEGETMYETLIVATVYDNNEEVIDILIHTPDIIDKKTKIEIEIAKNCRENLKHIRPSSISNTKVQMVYRTSSKDWFYAESSGENYLIKAPKKPQIAFPPGSSLNYLNMNTMEVMQKLNHNANYFKLTTQKEHK